MTTEWFVKREGKQGPFSAAQLRRLAQNGEVTLDTEVKRRTDKRWFTARCVKGLFPADEADEELPMAEKDEEEDQPAAHQHPANVKPRESEGHHAKTVSEKICGVLVAVGFAFLGLGIIFVIYSWFKATGLVDPRDGVVPFYAGIAAVIALGALFLILLVTELVASKKGINIPGLEYASIVIVVGWACIAIPGLFVLVAVNVGTKIIATLGGLLPLLVFLILLARRQ